MIAKLSLFLFWAWTLVCVGWLGLVIYLLARPNAVVVVEGSRHEHRTI